ncbi:hypothetical protein QVD17_16091 [Tagetes erecta]|uniref:Uncharacterized protein n=1 Tax=Tagetes erecta TaxID=13708 RepID=A0AAD8KW54_TARER|nr:hypothetical protein QVD17_16091 [Tagetes erecta]
MVFGMKRNSVQDETETKTHISETPRFVDLEDDEQAPEGYKPPSSEKARLDLLDECLRDVKKELEPIKDTWYMRGVSVVSNGWSNWWKKGSVIAQFLIGTIEHIGPSNVLQVVTVANCKAAYIADFQILQICLNKKWDVNPGSAYIEGSSARLEEMVWKDFDDEGFLTMGNEKTKS